MKQLGICILLLVQMLLPGAMLASPQQSSPSAAVPEPREVEKFRSAGFRFTGNALVPTKDLLKVSAPYEHQEITINDLVQLTQEIRELYVKRGYSATAVELPPQGVRPNEDILIIIKEPGARRKSRVQKR